AYASIPNSAVLGVAAALLEAAGYGREAAALPKAAGEPDTSSMATLYEAQDGLDQVVRKALDRWMADKLDAKVEGINQAEKRYQYDEGFKDGYAEARAEVDAKHLPWKYAMKSDTSSLDEMTRTASEDGTADEVDEFVNTRPKFTEGDRVDHVEYPGDGPGTITETAMYGWDWRVVWDNHDVPDSWCKNDELRVYVRRDAESQSYAWGEDEFVNTRPTFAVGDRVQHIEDAEHGTVRGLCYWPGCDIKRYMKECFRVEWDADQDNRQHHDPAELKRIDNTLGNPKGGGMTRIALADRVVAVV